MSSITLPLGDLFARRTESVNPARHADETFELFSVPSYDGRMPDLVTGAEIGSTKVSVLPGDVLLCKIVPHIRRAWVVPPRGSIRQIGSGEWIVMRDERFHSDYLRHLVLSDSFHALFMSTVAGVGGSLMRARPSYASTIPIRLPSLPEQRRIAAILDQADELRTKSRRALELLDELADSLFVDMFGSLDNSIGEPTALIELGRVVTGKTPPSASEGMFGDFVPFVTPGDIGRELTLGRGLSRSGAAMVPLVASGSLLVCCIGATIGKIGMATELSAFNQQINAVEWGPRVDPTFGLFAVRQRREEIVNRASSTTMPILNKGHFQKIQIAIPEIDRQRLFAKKIAVLTDQKKKSQSADVHLDELSASLQHLAFRGEL